MADTLYVVVPCFNEKEVLPDSAEKLKNKMESLIEDGVISEKSKILLVNDGSSDSTWDIILELNSKNDLFRGISLSRNRGHQNAVFAGMMYSREFSDCVITIDADLQDDLNAFDKMLSNYYNGCDIVYGVRSDRKKDSAFKRITAQGYYKILKLLGCEIVYNHADFRLLSKRAVKALSEFKEVNLFLRGIVPMLGFKTASVEYERKERLAGESKYPLKKMLALAFEGITSLSIKPIRLVTVLGFIVLAVSFAMIIYTFISYFTNNAVHGWSSTLCSIWVLGGLQLFSIGIVGEYVGKIYLETKSRPKYFISDVTENPLENR